MPNSLCLILVQQADIFNIFNTGGFNMAGFNVEGSNIGGFNMAGEGVVSLARESVKLNRAWHYIF